uniref:D7 salivary protein n=1 Tax=Lutzomyia longipalpis TaxID=7200 RepID=Q95V88_LUTLO|nr:D7 salivary protein [Lutzomyia longipalpis]
MNFLLKIFSLLCLCGLGYSWQDVRNADQTLWAYRSCQKNPEDKDHVPQWRKFELPDDEKTHCYVKCVWTRLGAYNENENVFKIDVITKQFNERGLEVPAGLDQELGGSTDGTCKAVYDKSMKFFKSHFMDFRNAYYATYDGSDEWFSKNPDVKPKGTKVSEYCKNKDDGDCKHSCSMYYYRLIDEDNLVIPFSNLPDYPEDKLEECRNEAKSANECKSSVIYQCLENADKSALDASLNILDEFSGRY